MPHIAKSVKSLFANLLMLPPVEARPRGGLLMVHRTGTNTPALNRANARHTRSITISKTHSGGLVDGSEGPKPYPVCARRQRNRLPAFLLLLLPESQIKEMFIGDRGVECRALGLVRCRIAAHVQLKWAVEKPHRLSNWRLDITQHSGDWPIFSVSTAELVLLLICGFFSANYGTWS
jgi:hypothetical protein